MTKLSLEQHEFVALKAIIDDRLNTLQKNLAKNSDRLDEYESDIRNYTTYDLHVKLSKIKILTIVNNIPKTYITRGAPPPLFYVKYYHLKCY